MKPRKVGGRSTSLDGRAVLHQAADKSFVSGQELRWDEEGLCTMEDSQLATGFGGEVGNVDFSGKLMADSETQKLERKDIFQRIVEKVDWSGVGGCRWGCGSKLCQVLFFILLVVHIIHTPYQDTWWGRLFSH